MILNYFKKAEKIKNRIIIPKIMIDKFGSDYILEANVDTGIMKLTPLKKGK